MSQRGAAYSPAAFLFAFIGVIISGTSLLALSRWTSELGRLSDLQQLGVRAVGIIVIAVGIYLFLKGAVPIYRAVRDAPSRQHRLDLCENVRRQLAELSTLYAQGQSKNLEEVPTFIILNCIGQAAEAVLRAKGLVPVSEAGPPVPPDLPAGTCFWWVSEQALWLELRLSSGGQYLQPGDRSPAAGAERQREWMYVLRQFAGQQPVDGLIVALGLEQVLTRARDKELPNTALARTIHQRLCEALQCIGRRVPITLLYDQREQWPGFPAFFTVGERSGTVGISIAGDAPVEFERSFNRLCNELHERIGARAAITNDVITARAIIALPATMMRWAEPLVGFLRAIVQRPLQQGLWLRSHRLLNPEQEILWFESAYFISGSAGPVQGAIALPPSLVKALGEEQLSKVGLMTPPAIGDPCLLGCFDDIAVAAGSKQTRPGMSVLTELEWRRQLALRWAVALSLCLFGSAAISHVKKNEWEWFDVATKQLGALGQSKSAPGHCDANSWRLLEDIKKHGEKRAESKEGTQLRNLALDRAEAHCLKLTEDIPPSVSSFWHCRKEKHAAAETANLAQALSLLSTPQGDAKAETTSSMVIAEILSAINARDHGSATTGLATELTPRARQYAGANGKEEFDGSFAQDKLVTLNRTEVLELPDPFLKLPLPAMFTSKCEEVFGSSKDSVEKKPQGPSCIGQAWFESENDRKWSEWLSQQGARLWMIGPDVDAYRKQNNALEADLNVHTLKMLLKRLADEMELVPRRVQTLAGPIQWQPECQQPGAAPSAAPDKCPRCARVMAPFAAFAALKKPEANHEFEAYRNQLGKLGKFLKTLSEQPDPLKLGAEFFTKTLHTQGDLVELDDAREKLLKRLSPDSSSKRYGWLNCALTRIEADTWVVLSRIKAAEVTKQVQQYRSRWRTEKPTDSQIDAMLEALKILESLDEFGGVSATSRPYFAHRLAADNLKDFVTKTRDVLMNRKDALKAEQAQGAAGAGGSPAGGGGVAAAGGAPMAQPLPPVSPLSALVRVELGPADCAVNNLDMLVVMQDNQARNCVLQPGGSASCGQLRGAGFPLNQMTLQPKKGTVRVSSAPLDLRCGRAHFGRCQAEYCLDLPARQLASNVQDVCRLDTIRLVFAGNPCPQPAGGGQGTPVETFRPYDHVGTLPTRLLRWKDEVMPDCSAPKPDDAKSKGAGNP